MNALSVSFISSMGRCCLCGDLSRMNLPLGFLLEFLDFCRPLSVRLKSIPIGMGNTCKPMAVSFQCMTKFSTNKKKKKKPPVEGFVPCQGFLPSLTKAAYLALTLN